MKPELKDTRGLYKRGIQLNTFRKIAQNTDQYSKWMNGLTQKGNGGVEEENEQVATWSGKEKKAENCLFYYY